MRHFLQQLLRLFHLYIFRLKISSALGSASNTYPRSVVLNRRSKPHALKTAAASVAFTSDPVCKFRPRSRPHIHLLKGLIYHAHLRPLTSPIAAMLSLSSNLHRRVSKTLPTPGGILRAMAPTNDSSLASIANALELPPIHVDHVAEAACQAIERNDASGVFDTQAMRSLIGWSELGEVRHSG